MQPIHSNFFIFIAFQIRLLRLTMLISLPIILSILLGTTLHITANPIPTFEAETFDTLKQGTDPRTSLEEADLLSKQTRLGHDPSLASTTPDPISVISHDSDLDTNPVKEASTASTVISSPATSTSRQWIDWLGASTQRLVKGTQDRFPIAYMPSRSSIGEISQTWINAAHQWMGWISEATRKRLAGKDVVGGTIKDTTWVQPLHLSIPQNLMNGAQDWFKHYTIAPPSRWIRNSYTHRASRWVGTLSRRPQISGTGNEDALRLMDNPVNPEDSLLVLPTPPETEKRPESEIQIENQKDKPSTSDHTDGEPTRKEEPLKPKSEQAIEEELETHSIHPDQDTRPSIMIRFVDWIRKLWKNVVGKFKTKKMKIKKERRHQDDWQTCKLFSFHSLRRNCSFSSRTLSSVARLFDKLMLDNKNSR